MSVKVENGMIVMDVERYKDLIKDESLLERLQGAGVDNWSGYSEAWHGYDEDGYPDEDTEFDEDEFLEAELASIGYKSPSQ